MTTTSKVIYTTALADVSPQATFALTGPERRGHMHLRVTAPDLTTPEAVTAFFNGCRHLVKEMRERVSDIRGYEGPDPMFPECRTAEPANEFIYDFWWSPEEWDVDGLVVAINPFWFGSALQQYMSIELKA